MTDAISNDIMDSSEIDTCIQQSEVIIQTLDCSLNTLKTMRRNMLGPSITYNGTTKLLTEWLTEWEDECHHDINLGQYIIEKLANCTEVS